MSNLWSKNHPRNFWQPIASFPDQVWQSAITLALPQLGLDISMGNIDEVLHLTLGEGRFGNNHWDMGTIKKVYYLLKPLIPRSLTNRLRKMYSHNSTQDESWLIDKRYVGFLWEVMRQVLFLCDQSRISIINFWPDQKSFAFVLTHDVETGTGQDFVDEVSKLEESLGLRSSFNFVPERYKVNHRLLEELRNRGFEIGVHGYKHNGRLFNSQRGFSRKARRINTYLKEWDACGFRSELTLRQPEWMQMLDVTYDLSFFDSDPFEPIPGGAMSIWPFFIGHFVELPYTLVQDNTLFSLLGQDSPELWLRKVEFVKKFNGLVLVNTHPDYLLNKSNWIAYVNFLKSVKNMRNYWHALPGDAARWWNTRMGASPETELRVLNLAEVAIVNDELTVRPTIS